MHLSVYNSPLGSLYFLFDQNKLVYASFDAEKATLWQKKHFPRAEIQSAPMPPDRIEELNAYFLGKPLVWSCPLRLIGTPFQKQVWAEIHKIPYGQVTTYKKIATSLNSKAFQAVGQAVGANPISIVVPCHRVLGTNWFGGYGDGLNRKRLLLELENVTLAPNLNV